MGDRTTPMKFGPEWLRNMSREPTSSGSPGSGGAHSSTPPIRPLTSIATASNTTTPPNTSKVLLAKLRYGREEMLALYDRQTAEAPPQLKSIELLYQPRGKPPYALNNNFEDDTRDINMRNNPPTSGISPADRYGQGRGRGMTLGDGRGRGGISSIESRGRARGFVRQTSLGRSQSWHNGGQRTYPGSPDDDPNPPRGLWNNGNGITPPGIRPTPEQAEWANKTPYRKNRQNHTNWRQQQYRDEGEEWRSSDGARRGQEKWDREWTEKNNQEKPWTTNRRQWGGDNNEDALPEWALENSETCGGTFDSSGAFHGYSNDDSNLPKAQEAAYPLARSHTHGSFARSRTVEEGSEEWWASEKAKKLSSKRFDATEVKFKKHATSGISEDNSGGNTNVPATNTGLNTNSGQTRDKSKLESIRNRSATPPLHNYSPELQDEAAALPVKREPEHKHDDDKPKDRMYQTNYSENPQPSSQQRIDMLLRAEEHDTSNERGNYKSVMMTPNNNRLRQKHQNIGKPTNDTSKRLHLFENANKQARPNRESDEESQQKQHETKLVEDLLDMSLNDDLQVQLLNASQSTGMTNQMSSPGMQMRMNNPLLNQNLGMNQQNPNMPSSPSMPQGSMMRPIGITNSMLNASLGLPMTGMPLSNMASSPISNTGLLSSNLQGLGGNMQNPMQGMQTGLPSGMQMVGLQSGMQGNGYQPSGGMPGNMQSGGMNNSNLQAGSGIPGFQGVGNNSLFLQGAPNTMQNPNDMTIHGQQAMYPMHSHSLQQSASQTSFNAASMYGNMMQPPPTGPLPNVPLTEQWYYEDPKKTIQGPFVSKEMYNWYRAGFFSHDLMVRRACESGLRPLANYGIMPFGPMDLLPHQFNQMAARFDMRQHNAHDNNMMNAQQAGLGPEVESLWSQPTPNDMMWIQQSTTPRDDNNRVSNLSMYFWDQPSGMSNSLLPEAITKEMKTEDEILAQMRASQAEPAAQNLSFMPDAVSPEEAFTAGTNIAPNLEELQKLIESDMHVSASQQVTTADAAVENATAAAATTPPTTQRPRSAAAEKKSEKAAKTEPIPEVSAKQQAPIKTVEPKPAKQPVKAEEKPVKTKEVATTKTKTKKQKDEKKEDPAEIKVKGEEKKPAECPTAEQESLLLPGSWFHDNLIKRLQNRSEETSPIDSEIDEQKRSEEPLPLHKNKKDDKSNKKDLEKEKKEWLKDGFTIVKGAEKKESKKKEKEEARVAEEAEKKRIEEEKRALIEAEKNRTPEPVTRRQQMEIGQTQRQAQSQPQVEAVPKKAPWSAPVATRDGLALSDIQRLEREKKLEQMKEQQLMMQAIAQQQAAAAHREQQEIQAGQQGWAKKKQLNSSPPGQTLTEIQAEARLQAAAIAAAATAAAREEALATPPPVNITPWGATNGGGFWDSPSSIAPSPCANELKCNPPKHDAPKHEAPKHEAPKHEAPKHDAPKRDASTRDAPMVEVKPKKKVTVSALPKKETSPSADFESWCSNVLSNWRDAANIDIPTFVAFLRDIESPYEVKDYVKCYLGDTKDSNDFSRQFLERRSRLLRVGMVTPSDDLCSPAVAINPRTSSGSDYTEVKSKGKKTKKNKMFKVDARILGFSVTASEDRINIGDIDTV